MITREDQGMEKQGLAPFQDNSFMKIYFHAILSKKNLVSGRGEKR